MEERQKVTVGVYYEMLRPANDSDLEAAGPKMAAILRKLPPGGYVPDGDLGRYGRGAESAFRWACSNGIMRKSRLSGRAMRFESVRFWMSQLNLPKAKNVSVDKGTRYSYAAALDAFDGWLRGRKFPVRESVVDDGRVVVRSASRKFSDIEDLLRFGEDPGHGAAAVRRILRQYLADSAASGCSLSTALVHCAAIKSYFAVHDVPADVQVSRNRYQPRETRDDSQMSLPDFYKMMIAGRMDVMMMAITMIKFQAGLDSSTLADRFNFEAYGQIIRHFGTEDYDAWDLDKCPVPIKLVRVKTGMRYTTFMDRDAVSLLRDYLRWKEHRRGKHHKDEPLFVTQRGTPVGPGWISARFSRAAINAGIQSRVSRRVFRVRSHEVRDLLKSTLMVAGCAPYAADHVLGHAPRDSYEKQAVLYPEMLRREYAKASGLLNVFASFERHLGTAGGRHPGQAAGPPPEHDPYRSMEERLQETQAEVRRMTGVMAEMLRIVASAGDDGPGMGDRLRQMIRDLEGGGEGRR